MTTTLEKDELLKKYKLNSEKKELFEEEANKDNSLTIECYCKISALVNIDLTEFNEREIKPSEVEIEKKKFITSKIEEKINLSQICDIAASKFTDCGFVIHEIQSGARNAFPVFPKFLNDIAKDLCGFLKS